MHAKPQNNFGRLIGHDGVAANFWGVWPGHAGGKGADWEGVPQKFCKIIRNVNSNKIHAVILDESCLFFKIK